MIKHWIHDLDELAGLDMVESRGSRPAKGDDEAAAHRGRAKRSLPPWRWLAKLRPSQKRMFDRGT